MSEMLPARERALAPEDGAEKEKSGYSLYRDIAGRTQGDIYIGVVGPVRTGKSTLIKALMEKTVLPLMPPGPRRDRAQDEMPQSASGRSVMTTQPKFIPGEGAADIDLDGQLSARVRLVDSVGFMVPGAMAGEDARMVSTPWSDADIPFEEAARLGTRKVMQDHATLGLIVTCDGTVADIPRQNYVAAEEESVREMKASGKPFSLVLNSAHPESAEAQALQAELTEKYDAPVTLLSARDMSGADTQALLANMLLSFPLREVHFDLPAWVDALDEDHWLVQHVMTLLRALSGRLHTLRDKDKAAAAFAASPYLKTPQNEMTLPGEGTVSFTLPAADGLFNQVLSEQCGAEITGDAQLLSLLKSLMTAKREYDRMAGALRAVSQTGYGLVLPSMEEIALDEPELARQGTRYGVRLHASAPALHLVRSEVETEITPVLGGEAQSQEFVQYLQTQYRQDPQLLWSTNFFGKSLKELVQESLQSKMNRLPANTQEKVQTALSRMLNEGEGGIVCILL